MDLTSVISQSPDYCSFRSNVPYRKIVVDEDPTKVWKVYDGGPKSVRCPLVCLPPVSGTADVFFRQILSLSAKGVRVISVNASVGYPVYWTLEEWSEGFAKLIDTLQLDRVHLFGASLGGFLAQKFAEYSSRTSRVASFVLCNTFIDTAVFQYGESAPFLWMLPAIVLKKMVMGNYGQQIFEAEIANSIDFMVEKVKEELYKCYPQAKLAHLKSGGNFPYLSRTEDVNLHLLVWASVATLIVAVAGQNADNDYPDGYFPFEESPSRIPPKVRKPPYVQADVDCPGFNAFDINSLDNLCGDLNKGYIPRSPFGTLIEGQPYPFELIRNKTLDFFSNTLPVLKNDNNLPKVAKYQTGKSGNKKSPSKAAHKSRPVRSTNETDVGETTRQARGFCEHNYGLICSILKIWNGRQVIRERIQGPQIPGKTNSDPKRDNFGEEEPMTPCPSIAEYVTPVFAKNYQGVWRYVVQIPHEGYFTQTVEVTKCLQKKCNFMDGSCLASPRWLSLLVAELYYPHARFPTPKPELLLGEPEDSPTLHIAMVLTKLAAFK
nr:EOG090X06KU [Triops cancriformis]